MSRGTNLETRRPGTIIAEATEVDQFPLNHYQWLDSDGDWWGDNQVGDDADAFVCLRKLHRRPVWLPRHRWRLIFRPDCQLGAVS